MNTVFKIPSFYISIHFCNNCVGGYYYSMKEDMGTRTMASTMDHPTLVPLGIHLIIYLIKKHLLNKNIRFPPQIIHFIFRLRIN